MLTTPVALLLVGGPEQVAQCRIDHNPLLVPSLLLLRRIPLFLDDRCRSGLANELIRVVFVQKFLVPLIKQIRKW